MLGQHCIDIRRHCHLRQSTITTSSTCPRGIMGKALEGHSSTIAEFESYPDFFFLLFFLLLLLLSSFNGVHHLFSDIASIIRVIREWSLWIWNLIYKFQFRIITFGIYFHFHHEVLSSHNQRLCLWHHLFVLTDLHSTQMSLFVFAYPPPWIPHSPVSGHIHGCLTRSAHDLWRTVGVQWRHLLLLNRNNIKQSYISGTSAQW